MIRLVSIIFIVGFILTMYQLLQGASITYINDCISISTPGYYSIMSDQVSRSELESCIVVSSSNVLVEGNQRTILSSERKGVAILVINSNNVTIRNLVVKGHSTGIKVINSSNIRLEGLVFEDNDIGVEIEDSYNVIVFNNTIHVNNIGMRLRRARDNYIYYNDFLVNNQHVELIDSGRNYWNAPQIVRYIYQDIVYHGNIGNYWDTYIGVGREFGGCWLTPQIIDDINVDHRPLKNTRDHYRIIELREIATEHPPSPIINRPLPTESYTSERTSGAEVSQRDSSIVLIIALIIVAIVLVGIVLVLTKK